jgi:hypothetical protein
MKYARLPLVSLALFASCTAINQQNAFLDALPRPVDNLVFSDNFENGLGQWNQVSGTWSTGTPASIGRALIAPSSASATTFSINTVSAINLTGRSRCIMEYEVSFQIGATAGTSAKILYGNLILADFKQLRATTTISSGGTFGKRRIRLPDNSSEKLILQTTVIDGTAAGSATLYLDNVSITCNLTVSDPVTIANEDFETSSTNWTTTAIWTRTAGQGFGGSWAMHHALTNSDTTNTMTYMPTINLSGRQGCKLSYYYKFSSVGGTSAEVRWNNNRFTTYLSTDGANQAGSLQYLLTAFEGVSNNQLAFWCSDLVGGGNSVGCTIDNVLIACEE